MSGMSGMGTAGNYDGATASGVLIARDGIVGPWLGATMTPQELDLDNAANLEDWSQMVRFQTVMQQLVSDTAVRMEGDAAKVYHVGEASGAGGLQAAEFASFTRPTLDDFKSQLELVRDYADLRGDRMPEILTQAGGFVPYMGAIAGLHPGRRKYTYEMLELTQVFATQIVFAVKNKLACLRPDAFSAQVQPAIPTPGHGTLPSGHATESFAAAVILAHLMNEELAHGTTDKTHVDQLMLQAARIAINRHVAGVHFPVDSMAGATLGLLLGQYMVARAEATAFNPGEIASATFDGTKCVSSGGVPVDFSPAPFVSASGNDPLDLSAAATLYDEAIERLDALDAPGDLAQACVGRGFTARRSGKLDDAARWLERGHALCEAQGDPNGAAQAIRGLAELAMVAGDMESARAHNERALELSTVSGNRIGVAAARNNLGEVARFSGPSRRPRGTIASRCTPTRRWARRTRSSRS